MTPKVIAAINEERVRNKKHYNGIPEFALSEIFKISKILDYTGKIVWNTSQPNGQPRRCVSYEKAKQNFGFEPKITLDDGLQKTIDWYISQNN